MPTHGSDDFSRVQAWALANVETLAAEYAGVELRRGRCACPLHGGDNPDAFSVANGKGWHCFTGDCGGGDGVGLVRRLRFAALSEKDGRLAALRELAPRAGVWLAAPQGPQRPHRAPPRPPARPTPPPPAVDPLEAAEADRAARAAALLRRDVQRAACVEGMTLGPRGRAYLAGRGFNPDHAGAFGFRSLEDVRAWRTLTAQLAESFLPEELAAAGVPSRVPLALPCLVIPYHTRAGTLWSWRLRSLKGEKANRYRTLPGDELPDPFNAPALENLTAADTLHIVEGELNAYALALTGARAIGLDGAQKWRPAWTAAVCAAGTLVLWYDDDPAGNAGYARLIKTLFPVGVRPRVRARVRRVRIDEDDAKDANDLHHLGRLTPLMTSAPWTT